MTKNVKKAAHITLFLLVGTNFCWPSVLFAGPPLQVYQIEGAKNVCCTVGVQSSGSYDNLLDSKELADSVDELPINFDPIAMYRVGAATQIEFLKNAVPDVYERCGSPPVFITTSNLENCMAVTTRGGHKYIILDAIWLGRSAEQVADLLYDTGEPKWNGLKRIRGTTLGAIKREDDALHADAHFWVLMGVFYHVLGHCGLDHAGRRHVGTPQQLELEADSLSGSMFATESGISAAVQFWAVHFRLHPSRTHPASGLRQQIMIDSFEFSKMNNKRWSKRLFGALDDAKSGVLDHITYMHE